MCRIGDTVMIVGVGDSDYKGRLHFLHLFTPAKVVEDLGDGRIEVEGIHHEEPHDTIKQTVYPYNVRPLLKGVQ